MSWPPEGCRKELSEEVGRPLQAMGNAFARWEEHGGVVESGHCLVGVARVWESRRGGRAFWDGFSRQWLPL